MFWSFYQSAWHHPGMAWIAGLPLVVVFVLALRSGRRTGDPDPRRRAWLWAFAVLELAILVDAGVTGALSPLPAGSRAADLAGVIFVILGDLRFFYLVERQRGEAAPSGGAALRALGVAFPVAMIMPMATGLLRAFEPVRFQGNFLYFVYEAGLVVAAVAFCWLRAPQVQDRADRRRRYVARLGIFEAVQYGLWVAADALILFGDGARDLGWLLRLVPNAMYYVCFVPVATWATPSGTRV